MIYELKVITYFSIATVSGFVIPFIVAIIREPSTYKEVGTILFVIALIGACSGTAGGLSRVGAVGTIIPSVLGLLGGMAIYLFGIDRSKGLIASFAAAALSISLLVSFTLAASYRNIGDDHRDIRSYCAKAYTNADLLSNKEAFTKFRERMGKLCNLSMSWEIAE